MVRTGLRTILELQPDMEVVGEAGSGEQAPALVAGLRPDIVLLDLVLPGLSGVDTARRLRDTHPDVKVVVLTSFSGQDSVLPAVRAGVAGYLLKDVGPAELAGALRSVHHGGAHCTHGSRRRCCTRSPSGTHSPRRNVRCCG